LQSDTDRIDMGWRDHRVSLSQIVPFKDKVASEAYLCPRCVAEAVKLVKVPVVRRLGVENLEADSSEWKSVARGSHLGELKDHFDIVCRSLQGQIVAELRPGDAATWRGVFQRTRGKSRSVH
jgi:hypothetical protein